MYSKMKFARAVDTGLSTRMAVIRACIGRLASDFKSAHYLLSLCAVA